MSNVYLEKIAEMLDKEASNAFTRNIGKAFSAAAKRGETGGHMMAMRAAKDMPASAAKSQALQQAMKSGPASGARHVTGNPAVNKEIAGIKDIGSTSRFTEHAKTKAGIISKPADPHQGILEKARAINAA